MSTTLKIIAIALFYILTIGTGAVIHKKGRPFPPLMSALHKLIALAVIVATILLVRSGFTAEAPSVLAIILFSVTALLLISLFVTGAILSGENELPPIVLLLHDIATYLTPVTAAISFILIL